MNLGYRCQDLHTTMSPSWQTGHSWMAARIWPAIPAAAISSWLGASG